MEAGTVLASRRWEPGETWGLELVQGWQMGFISCAICDQVVLLPGAWGLQVGPAGKRAEICWYGWVRGGCGEQGGEMGKSLKLRSGAKAARALRGSDAQRFQRGRDSGQRAHPGYREGTSPVRRLSQVPGSKKMILVQPLGWGERRFRHTPPPRPLPSTGQMRDLWVGSCEGYLLALQVPSSLFRKKKQKHSSSGCVMAMWVRKGTQRTSQTCFQSVAQGPCPHLVGP